MTQFRRVKRAVDGVLLLDKPLGVSSNGALQHARRLYQAAKAGHTGVLDPLASGLLPVCFGEATKFSSFLLDADKAYRTTVRFGQKTTTGDAEGEVISEREVAFDETALREAIARFSGEIDQVPPMYSALKHQGKALYEYARAGVEIERPARRVTIHSIELLSFDGVSAELDVRCSKGTYIRVLGEDIGEALGCGAHLSALRRTATAGFTLEASHTLPALEEMDEAGRDACLLPVDVLVGHLPEHALGEADFSRFMHGMAVQFDKDRAIMPRFRVYRASTRQFLGLGEVREAGFLHPARLMATKVAD
ncbi:tRNA pseudouridine(55) synthase TruB [Crenobacter caeni]|uniref:tRNA pseudouridine synthase B n=1 Tax=Crenobacter caeni TaxID=2705474 RepID=A0A6B2KRC5_9NEIS|nr:tRNA pseudouridine(55) synthase TruB [Crenobacter caeni]NDV12611.1 tRNA pseudouridine(55) synthase TruB [Crenobacter caeni]